MVPSCASERPFSSDLLLRLRRPLQCGARTVTIVDDNMAVLGSAEHPRGPCLSTDVVPVLSCGPAGIMHGSSRSRGLTPPLQTSPFTSFFSAGGRSLATLVTGSVCPLTWQRVIYYYYYNPNPEPTALPHCCAVTTKCRRCKSFSIVIKFNCVILAEKLFCTSCNNQTVRLGVSFCSHAGAI